MGKYRGKIFFFSILLAGAFAEAQIASTTDSMGERKILTILLDTFERTQDCSQSTVSNLLFSDRGSSVRALVREASFGKLLYSGVVTEPLPIQFPSICRTGDIGNLGDAAAVAAGYDLSQFHQIIYVLPKYTSCSFDGQATRGGYVPRAWVNGPHCSNISVYAHETLHSANLGHASTESDAYGDLSSIMSNTPRLVHPNTPQKYSMGWISQDRVSEMSGTVGRFQIALSENDISATQLVKIPIPGDLLNSWYLSLRKPVGYDANLSSTFASKVSVHRWNGERGSSTYLLGAVGAGQKWGNNSGELHVEVLSVDSTHADVLVTITEKDTQAPTTVILSGSKSLVTSGKGKRKTTRPVVSLSWTASSDNSGEVVYRVIRNGSYYGYLGGTSFTDNNVAAGTSYTYSVIAIDKAGNISDKSNELRFDF